MDKWVVRLGKIKISQVIKIQVSTGYVRGSIGQIKFGYFSKVKFKNTSPKKGNVSELETSQAEPSQVQTNCCFLFFTKIDASHVLKFDINGD